MKLHFILLVLAALVGACRSGRGANRSPRSSGPTPPLTRPPAMTRVNTGAQGMTGRIRWAYSPDSSAIMAVEDWASIEAEPFFDGFRIASDRFGTIVGRDSVWDAAPSPDWRMAAFGAALIVHAGESGTVSAKTMTLAARQLGVSVGEARSASFNASGMAAAAGFARLGVIDLASGRDRWLGSLSGWRVRWNAAGSRIFGGLGPRIANDDAPSAAWVALSPAGDSSAQHAGEAAMDTTTVHWIAGPSLDAAITPDTDAVTLSGPAHAVTSANDTIRVDQRIIGGGTALAATRSGCYVLALVRDPDATEYGPRWRAAIYDAGCRLPEQRSP